MQAANTSFRVTAKNQSRIAVAVMAAGLAVLLAAFSWLCARSPNIDFLTSLGSAQWILYPKPPDAIVAPRKELSTEFRSTFVLAQLPARAALKFRSFRRCAVTINGKSASPPSNTSTNAISNWRQPIELEVSSLLRAGSNEVAATVVNGYGPPVLCLSLRAGSLELETGPDWDCSEMGAVWRKARLASKPPVLEKGQRLFGGEDVLACCARCWPTLLVFTIISGGVVAGGAWWFARRAAVELPSRFTTCALAGIAVLWVALFVHNLPFLPNTVGFDCLHHLDYVSYIQTHRALPLPSDGMEMYHPPLYYLVCNAILAPLSAGAWSDAGIYAMRIFGMLTGLSNCAFIFLSCRILFPGRAEPQIFGLILAGCLPAHLYLCHYVTNEPLGSALMSGTCYFYLRLVTSESLSWRLAAALGLCLGGALLAKMTALVVLPFVFCGLAYWLLISRPREVGAWLTVFGTTVLCGIAMVGWYYIRMWIRCGTPIVSIPGDAGSQIWGEDGFRTTAFYTRFGQCLIRPAYSVFNGFLDGIFSTLWGDSLHGGQGTIDFRPPWNYDLMAVGTLLGVIPTCIVLVGTCAALVRFVRRPDPAWWLPGGLGCATVAALIYVSLKLPFYFNVKAFYGLMALLPFCAFGALGWEVLARLLGKFRMLLAIAFGLWAINAYAGLWIRDNAPSTSVTRALFLIREHRVEPGLRLFESVLRQDQHNVSARKPYAVAIMSQNRLAEAQAQIELALGDAPQDAEANLISASILAKQGQLEAAARQGAKAIELGPGLSEAYTPVCEWLSRLGSNREVVATARQGLRIKPASPELHYFLGMALAKTGEGTESAEQLQMACDLKPDQAWMETLAAAYDNLGKLDQAVAAMNQAIKLAEAAGNENLATTDRGLLEAYQAKRAHPAAPR
jgi:Flp pilus assembly protein TadD